MRKGFVFTMDAVFALYITLMSVSILVTMLETRSTHSDDSLLLARLASDVSEVKGYNPSVTLPSFIATGSACVGKASVSSILVFSYGDIQTDPVYQYDPVNDPGWTVNSSVSLNSSEKVCMNG